MRLEDQRLPRRHRRRPRHERPQVVQGPPAGRRRHRGPDDGLHDDRRLGPARPRHRRVGHPRGHVQRGVQVRDLPDRSRSARSSCSRRGSRYVGDLGWELYVPMEQGRRLWEELWEAGQAARPDRLRHGRLRHDRPLEKGYRAYGAELDADYDVVEADMAPAEGQGPGLRRQGGRPAAAWPRSRSPGCARWSVDDHTSASGERRYMLGRQPIVLEDGSPIVDAKGRRSYATSAGASPSTGQARPAGVPAAGARGRGRQAVRASTSHERVPGDRRGRRRAAAVRPRQPAHPGLTMKVLVCIKRVPAVAGRITLTEDDRAIDSQVPRLRHRPARGVRGRGGGPPRRGARRRVRRPDPRPGGGPRAAPRRDGDRHLAGDPPRHRRGGVGPGVHGRRRSSTPSARTRPRAARSTSSCSATRPATPAATRSRVRIGRALGRPVLTGLKGLAVADGVVRGEQGSPGGRDVYEVPLPAVAGVLEGLNLPRYPSVPGRHPGEEQARRDVEPGPARTSASRCVRLVVPAGRGQAGHDPRRRAPRPRPPRSTCSTAIGVL